PRPRWPSRWRPRAVSTPPRASRLRRSRRPKNRQPPRPQRPRQRPPERDPDLNHIPQENPPGRPAWGLFLGNREGDRRAAMTLWESRSGADGGSPLPATGRRPCAGGLLGGRLAPIGGGAGGAAARLFGVAAATRAPAGF